MNPEEINNPIFKAGSAWAAVGISTWADAASMASVVAATLAAIYSFCLLSEWFWKKLWRPLLVRLGYLPADRRKEDRKDLDDE